MIRTLIVHDVTLISDLLTTVLEDQGDITVVGRATSPTEALEILSNSPCDVMVVNCLLPDEGALTLTRATAKQCGDVKVVIAGLVESQTAILHCLEAGAAGYVREADGVQQLMAVVRHAAQGEALVSPAVAGALIARVNELKRLATELNGYHETDMEQQATELTEREREILALLGEGYSNREIAEELVITVGTVKNHVHNILDKLDVHTRKQAAMVARQLALGEVKADYGTKFTWPDAMGIKITSRRDAAAML
jgi:DNA-binding NarL/FixJ family response regulator